jgi:hypothetical protein
MSKEIPFDVVDEEKTHELFILAPSPRIAAQASKVYNQAFKESLTSGAILRGVLEKKLRDEGLWDDDREERYLDLVKSIAKLDHVLNSGKEDGKVAKLSRAREAALELKARRAELNELLYDKNQYDEMTAEASADNARFNYLVSACIMDYKTRKPYFDSHDDYLDKSDQKVAVKIATKFANYLYGLDENYEEGLTENKFLRRFNFCDDKGRLIDSDGELINTEGTRIDDEGYRLNDDGVRVDINGNPILDDAVNVDTVDFEDDLSGPKKRKRTAKKE